MVEPHSSNFRVITTDFFGVRIFRKFTVMKIIINLEEWKGRSKSYLNGNNKSIETRKKISAHPINKYRFEYCNWNRFKTPSNTKTESLNQSNSVKFPRFRCSKGILLTHICRSKVDGDMDVHNNWNLKKYQQRRPTYSIFRLWSIVTGRSVINDLITL